MVADAGDPGTSVDVTGEVVFVRAPAAEFVLVTLTLKVQLACPARVAPARVIRLLPAVAVIVPPPQVPETTLGLATNRPAGSVSENDRLSSVCVAFGLARVKVREVEAPAGRPTTPKTLLRTGGNKTLTDAFAVFPVPPLAETTVTELFWTPATVPVTLTENEQDAPELNAAPLRETTPVPEVAVIVPEPHDPVSPFGLDTVNPAGRVSVNPIPVRINAEFGLDMEKLRVVVEPSAIKAVPKLLVITGGAPTVKVAVAVFPISALGLEVTVTELF